jgi:TolB protein
MVEPVAITEDEPGLGEPADPPRRRRRPSRRGLVVVLATVVVAIAVVALGATGRAGSPAGAGSPSAGAARSDPRVVLIDPNGALVTVDAGGHATILSDAPGTTYGFPAWSPDGSRVAAIAYGSSDAAISVFPVPTGGLRPSQVPAPVVVYRSAAVPPFYLYWTPDGRWISFLATQSDGISLRVAPADGSAPLDGGPGSVIRQGAPLYFDWIAADRLLLHVGSGAAAFLGEVGPDGSAAGPAIAGSGDFRAAVTGGSGRYLAFVRGAPPSAQLVVAARDGSAEHATPVFGPAAIVFDPTSDTVATIAAVDANAAPLAFPVGPLRLIDAAAGTTRTLVDGTVVGFFWSPDGHTIAVLRLQGGSGSTVAGRSIITAAGAVAHGGPPAISTALAAATPAPTPGPELHLLFVNVADGVVRSDRVVRPTGRFVNEFLPYFDQYALSHRIWAPDSSAILLPLVDDAGRDRLVSLEADGRPSPRVYDGTVGFWSP